MYIYLKYIVALIVHAAFAAPATIVPRIQSDNGFQLEPQDDQYTLRYASIQI